MARMQIIHLWKDAKHIWYQWLEMCFASFHRWIICILAIFVVFRVHLYSVLIIYHYPIIVMLYHIVDFWWKILFLVSWFPVSIGTFEVYFVFPLYDAGYEGVQFSVVLVYIIPNYLFVLQLIGLYRLKFRFIPI